MFQENDFVVVRAECLMHGALKCSLMKEPAGARLDCPPRWMRPDMCGTVVALDDVFVKVELITEFGPAPDYKALKCESFWVHSDNVMDYVTHYRAEQDRLGVKDTTTPIPVAYPHPTMSLAEEDGAYQKRRDNNLRPLFVTPPKRGRVFKGERAKIFYEPGEKYEVRFLAPYTRVPIKRSDLAKPFVFKTIEVGAKDKEFLELKDAQLTPEAVNAACDALKKAPEISISGVSISGTRVCADAQDQRLKVPEPLVEVVVVRGEVRELLSGDRGEFTYTSRGGAGADQCNDPLAVAARQALGARPTIGARAWHVLGQFFVTHVDIKRVPR